MATKKIIGKFELTGVSKATTSVGDLEKSLEEAREAIKGVAVGGQDFEQLAQHIQDTESRVKTLNKQMEGLEPQQKAEAFLKMGEGIAGGFAVAQGAMGLMGMESEEIEKIQLKVQSAISIAMGVRMMSEAALNVQIAKRVISSKMAVISTKAMLVANKLYSMATGKAVQATKLFKIALLSTGIGAIVVLIGALIAALSKTKETKTMQKTNIE